MKGSNKTKIVIIIISIIVVLAIITGIVLSFTTDIFKSDEEMFQRYIIQDVNVINNIIDISKETEYRKLLENNDFNESSTLELKYTNNEGKEENFTGNITGTNNNSNNLAYKDIKVNSGDKDIIEIEYLKENEIYGLHFVNIADKFATIDTSKNISTIIKYFGLDSKVSAEQINTVNLSELANLSEEEKEQLESKYLSIILKNITKDCYSSQNDRMITLSNGQSVTTNSYILKLDEKQVEDIYSRILSELYQDEIIIGKLEDIDNKIKEMGLNLTKDIKTQYLEYIDTEKKELEIENDLIVTLYETEGITVRTTIEYGNKTIEMDLNSSEQNDITIKYSNLISSEIQNTNISIVKEDNSLKISYEDYSNKKIEVTRNLEITDNNVKSNVNLKYSDEKVKGLDFTLNRDVNIGTASEIPTSFEKVGKILLNDYDDESIDYAFTTLRNRIIKALRAKRNETNSTLLNYIIEYNNQLEEEDKQEEEMKRKRFNSKFEDYEGQNVEQDIVLNMLDEAGKNMSNYQTVGRNQVKIYIQEGKENKDLAEEIKEELQKTETGKYNITIEYDDNAWINQIIIEIVQEEQ